MQTVAVERLNTALALPALLLLLAGGCVSWTPMVPPQVSLVDMRFESLTLFETTAVFTLRLANENPFPVTVDGGVYAMTLNGVRVGKGLSGDAVEVPRLATATIEVPVHVSHLALVFEARDAFERGTVDYMVSARLHTRGQERRSRYVESESRGTFSLPPAQTQRLDSYLPAVSTGPFAP
ncbi:MAG: Late embryogenesis abundant protein [Lentisphaerae bacterium ADurb.BinA184]|nr:MAG: Late embryogenesis abundant protein [Lentisphaerae bacterium ADurb.BinA184]